jgi:hypothetical protein
MNESIARERNQKIYKQSNPPSENKSGKRADNFEESGRRG